MRGFRALPLWCRDLLLALPVLALFLIWPEWYRNVIPENLKITLYSSLMQVYASLLGFIITATSIIIVFHDRPNKRERERVLEQHEDYATLFHTFTQTCWFLAVGLLVSVAALIGDPPKGMTHRVIASLVPATFFFLCLRIYRCIWFLSAAIRIMLSKGPSPIKP